MFWKNRLIEWFNNSLIKTFTYANNAFLYNENDFDLISVEIQFKNGLGREICIVNVRVCLHSTSNSYFKRARKILFCLIWTLEEINACIMQHCRPESGAAGSYQNIHFIRVKRSALMMRHFEPSWIHTHSQTLLRG